MNPTSLTTLMEDVSFLLGRISLLVPPLLLPLGGQRDALSGPVGSLYVPGMQKLLMKDGFASAPRRAMQDFGFLVSAAASRGEKRLLPPWGDPKGSAVAAARLEFLERCCVSSQCHPRGAQSSGCTHRIAQLSSLRGMGLSWHHHRARTHCDCPGTGQGLPCPMAGCWRCCNAPAPVGTPGVL